MEASPKLGGRLHARVLKKYCTWKQFGFRKKLEQLPYSSSSCFETLREDPQPVLWTCECKWRDTGRLGATSSPARLFVVTWSKLCCQSVCRSLVHRWTMLFQNLRCGMEQEELFQAGLAHRFIFIHPDGKSASQSMKWWKARHDDINPINLSCWVFQHLDIWIGRPQPEAVSSRSYSTVGAQNGPVDTVGAGFTTLQSHLTPFYNLYVLTLVMLFALWSCLVTLGSMIECLRARLWQVSGLQIGFLTATGTPKDA